MHNFATYKLHDLTITRSQKILHWPQTLDKFLCYQTECTHYTSYIYEHPQS